MSRAKESERQGPQGLETVVGEDTGLVARAGRSFQGQERLRHQEGRKEIERFLHELSRCFPRINEVFKFNARGDVRATDPTLILTSLNEKEPGMRNGRGWLVATAVVAAGLGIWVVTDQGRAADENKEIGRASCREGVWREMVDVE